MPTIVNIKGYRLYFVSFDGSEPMHVHVRKDNKNAKVWITPLAFAWSQFNEHENGVIIKILRNNVEIIQEKWHEHFGY